MSVPVPDITHNSTDGSSQLDQSDDNKETQKVKNYVKDLLKSRIFLGRYLERRLSDPRVGYRDVVLLSPAEVDMKRDLVDAQNKLRTVYPKTHWIGITDGAAIGFSGICLWTEIDNQPFGPFWFQIRSVKFRELEVITTVKCLRQITDSFLEIEPMLTGSVKKISAAASSSQSSINKSVETLSETYNDFVETLKGALSIRNVKEFITFLFAFIIAIFTGSTAFINFLGNFVLALIRELSILVQNSTPLFLGCLDFLTKCVGGFYILVAMIFRTNTPVPVDRRSIKYDRYRRDSRNFDYNDDIRRMSTSYDYRNID